MRPIRMVGPHDKKKFLAKENVVLINVTSSSQSWTYQFSPFFLGPVELYEGRISKNVENAWQFSKVYEKFTEDGNPTEAYWAWAEKGWDSKHAVRYPMWRGAVPLYSLWNGEKLGYIEARKKIYVPLYRRAVLDSGLLPRLADQVWDLQDQGLEVGFFDYDVYDHLKLGMTYDDCLNSKRKMGHAFVLAKMVEEHNQKFFKE